MKTQILYLILLLTTPLSHAEIVERVVAIVNDQLVTESDITHYQKSLRHGQLVDDLLVTDRKALLKSRKKLIEHIINEKLIDSEVKKQNLTVTVEKIEQEIRTIAKRNNISRNQLKAALKEQGVRFSDYQEFVRKRLERQSLVERAITSKIKISDDDVATAFYAKNPGRHKKQSFEYTIAHILFRPKSGDIASAKSRAEEVLKLVNENISFEKLASKHSEDPNFSSGGILGTFRTGEFAKEFENAVRDLSPGETSGLVKSRFGFHIFKLLDRRVISDPILNKQKEIIRSQLYQEAFKRQFSFWLDQKRRQSFIRVN